MGADGARGRRRLFAGFPAVRIACLLLPVACLLIAGQSRAEYPLEGMRLALPMTEGSQPTILYRLLQRRLAGGNGAPALTLTPLPGRGGSYAWRFLQGEPDNGYSLAALHLPAAMLLAADKDRVFAPDGMAPVALFAYAANALWVAEDSALRTPDDFAASARENGGSPVIAGVGSYTDQHMAHMILNRAAGIKSVYLPLTGTAEAAEAVRQKRAAACWGYALDRSSMPGLRPLAVAAAERCAVLPDTPTFREHALEVISGQHFGLAVPATVRMKLRREISAFFLDLFADSGVRAEAADAGFIPAPVTLEELPLFMERQSAALEGFLTDYAMFPKGRLPLWIPRAAHDEEEEDDDPQ